MLLAVPAVGAVVVVVVVLLVPEMPTLVPLGATLVVAVVVLPMLGIAAFEVATLAFALDAFVILFCIEQGGCIPMVVPVFALLPSLSGPNDAPLGAPWTAVSLLFEMGSVVDNWPNTMEALGPVTPVLAVRYWIRQQ
jgi:hypothetical protein